MTGIYEDIEATDRPVIKVAIYTRVSTDIQEEEGTSLDTQVENCLALAQANGYVVLKIFREVFTGSLYRERLELSNLRKMYKEGEINGVLFNTIDRLSRNQIHLSVLFEEMQHYNVRIECAKEQFDSTPAGQFMRNAFAFVAEAEREKMLQRSDDGKRKRARNGKLLGGGVPRYGYMWNQDRTAFVINPQEAGVVLRIYAMALEGFSIHSIAATLTREGVPTRGNIGTRKFKGVWLHSTVHRILSSPCYIGKALVYRTRQERVNGHRLTSYRAEEDQIHLPEGVIPALVDLATFEAVQIKLQENKMKLALNNTNREDTLLRSGFVVCGYCNRNGVVTHKSNGKINYRCKSTGDRERGECEGFTIATHKLDSAVWQHVVEIITNPNMIAQKFDEITGKNPAEGEILPVERRLQEIEKEVQSLVKMGQYAQSEEVVATFGKLLAQLEREKIGLLNEQKELQRIDLLYREKQKAIAVYRQKLEDLDDSFSYREKREVLDFFGVKVYVWRVGHTPRFKIISNAENVLSSDNIDEVR
ncbi:MAG TPA: recombinase family protein [Ktedonobacteraceae bacterium]|nr:recombinase family protein [Ktedonobacteraceae bacterium]